MGQQKEPNQARDCPHKADSCTVHEQADTANESTNTDNNAQLVDFCNITINKFYVRDLLLLLRRIVYALALRWGVLLLTFPWSVGRSIGLE